MLFIRIGHAHRYTQNFNYTGVAANESFGVQDAVVLGAKVSTGILGALRAEEGRGGPR